MEQTEDGLPYVAMITWCAGLQQLIGPFTPAKCSGKPLLATSSRKPLDGSLSETCLGLYMAGLFAPLLALMWP
jgi:hypothetical protein